MALETPEAQALARRIDDLTTAYLPAVVIFAAVELGLFDALERPRPLGDLARGLGATLDGTSRLCRALSGMDLLDLDGDVASLPPSVRDVLTTGGASSRTDVIWHHHRQLLPTLLRLSAAVRTGEPQHGAWPFVGGDVARAPYDELVRHPREVRAFVGAMDRASEGVGAWVASAVDLSSARVLVDVGGGGGVVARELLTALPGLVVHTVDVGEACRVARDRSAAAGLSERHVVHEADARLPLPLAGADAVLLSAVLADFPPAERAAILENARRALRPGGVVLVSETLLDDDRCGPPKAAFLSLLMLAALRGDQLSRRDLLAELDAAGFEGARVLPGTPRDLAVATFFGTSRKSTNAISGTDD
jgi:SAM-dependent methyltransferase